MQALPSIRWKYLIGVAVGFAIAFGVRSAGGILLIAFLGLLSLLWWFTNEDWRKLLSADQFNLAKKGVLFLGAALVVGYILALLTWPWGLQSPIAHPLESLQEMTNRSVELRVFFEGVFRQNSAQPWYYELKWIVMSNPLVVIMGVVLFLVSFPIIKREYGMAVFVFLVFGCFFTPLYMIYKKSSVHDTWRHLFFIYPFWVASASLGWIAISSYIKSIKYKALPTNLAIALLTPAMIWTVRSHPNQYVYFNELIGGVSGAYGYYDTDYYQNTGLQAAKWIEKEIKPIPGRKIVVASNMLGFGYYFAKDTNWIRSYYVRYGDRHAKEWDYYISYSRYISAAQLQQGHWPPGNVVHTVEVSGVPLCVVIARKSNAGISASAAMNAQKFPEAIADYAAYLKADPTDDGAWVNYAICLAQAGRIDEGIQAAKKATELDSDKAPYFELLSQLYAAKGDMQNAQKAKVMADDLNNGVAL
jgi:tetratricopeptide (TPR) repeat protein